MQLRAFQGILLEVVIGSAVGIGAYTCAYANGWSCLTDNPAACANCHVMSNSMTAGSNHRTARLDLQ